MPRRKQVQKLYWNWSKGISYSLLDTFLRCRMQCYLRYIVGWVPREMSMAIHFGQAFHFAMEHSYSEGHPREVTKAIKLYEKTVDQRTRAKQEFQKFMGMAAVTAEEYFRFYTDDFRNTWELLEDRFSVPYEYPDGKTILVNGIIDGAFWDSRKEPDFWVMDTKTSSRPDADFILRTFSANLQINLYAWAAYKRTGRVPKGAFINNVRRSEIYQRNDERLAVFLKRLREDIRKRPTFYFERPPYLFTEGELLEWKENQLDPIMADFREWTENDFPRYANPAALKYGNKISDYADAVCNGDFSGLIIRGEPLVRPTLKSIKGLKRASADKKTSSRHRSKV